MLSGDRLAAATGIKEMLHYFPARCRGSSVIDATMSHGVTELVLASTPLVLRRLSPPSQLPLSQVIPLGPYATICPVCGLCTSLEGQDLSHRYLAIRCLSCYYHTGCIWFRIHAVRSYQELRI